MPDALRDPVWQFVGAMLALLAILITILIAISQRRKKTLEYSTLSLTPILSRQDELAGEFQIFFQDELVTNVHLLEIELTNTGKVPIIPSDYERRVSINLGEGSKILTSEVSRTEPKNIDATVHNFEHQIIVEPILLNGGDSLILKSLVSNFAGPIRIDGRIVGVKSIPRRRDSLAVSLPIITLGVLAGFVMMALAFWSLIKFVESYRSSQDVNLILLLGVGVLFGFGIWFFVTGFKIIRIEFRSRTD